MTTVFSSFFPLANQNADAATTTESGADSDEIAPTLRILKIGSVAGPASCVTLNLEGTASDTGRGVARVELKINDPATLQLLSGYTPSNATGPGGEDDYTTWEKQLIFDQEGTYRVTARATDQAARLPLQALETATSTPKSLS